MGSFTEETRVWQEGTALPPTWTVQARHWPMPQPNLVPFRLRTSRSAHNRGVSGVTSTVCFFPLTVRVYGIFQLRKDRFKVQDLVYVTDWKLCRQIREAPLLTRPNLAPAKGRC